MMNTPVGGSQRDQNVGKNEEKSTSQQQQPASEGTQKTAGQAGKVTGQNDANKSATVHQPKEPIQPASGGLQKFMNGMKAMFQNFISKMARPARNATVGKDLKEAIDKFKKENDAYKALSLEDRKKADAALETEVKNTKTAIEKKSVGGETGKQKEPVKKEETGKSQESEGAKGKEPAKSEKASGAQGSEPVKKTEGTKESSSVSPVVAGLLKELTNGVSADHVEVENVAQAYIPTLSRLAEIKDTHPQDYKVLFSSVKAAFQHDIAATERGFAIAGSVTFTLNKIDKEFANNAQKGTREKPFSYMDQNMKSAGNDWAARSVHTHENVEYLCRRKKGEKPEAGQYMIHPKVGVEEYRPLAHMTPGVPPKVTGEHEEGEYVYYNIGNPFQKTQFEGRGMLGLPGNSMASDVGFVCLDGNGLLTFMGGSRDNDFVYVIENGKTYKMKQNNLIGGMLQGDALKTADPSKAKEKPLETCLQEFLEEGVSGSIDLTKEEEAEVQKKFEKFKTDDIEGKIKNKIEAEVKEGKVVDDERKAKIREEIIATPKHPPEKEGQIRAEAKLEKMDHASPKTREILKKITKNAENSYQGPMLRDGRNTNDVYMETTAYTMVLDPLTLARTGICQYGDPKSVQKEIEALEENRAPTVKQGKELLALRREKAELEKSTSALLQQLKDDYSKATEEQKKNDYAFDPTNAKEFPYYMAGGDDMTDVKAQPLGAISANRGWHSHANLKTVSAAFAAATMLKNGSMNDLTPQIKKQFEDATKIHNLRIKNDDPIADGAPIPKGAVEVPAK